MHHCSKKSPLKLRVMNMYSLNNSQSVSSRYTTPVSCVISCFADRIVFIHFSNFLLWKAAILTEMRALRCLFITFRPQIISLSYLEIEMCKVTGIALSSCRLGFLNFISACETYAWLALWSAVRRLFELSGCEIPSVVQLKEVLLVL